MRFKRLAQILLSLCLVTQLNFAQANKNYDEEITLPVGTNFDLEMEEITRYEYDGNYVKAQTVNGKEQFILQKTGDTIINVIMEENGQKTEMRVLVHIVTEQQFNGTEPTATQPKATTPAAATQTKPEATKPVETKPAANTVQPAAPATTPAKTEATKPAETKPAANTTQPAAPAATPANTETKPEAPAKAETQTTAVTEPAKVQAPAATTNAPAKTEAPKAPASTIYGTPVSRSTAVPTNTIEAAKLKAQNMAFDVLDLVNAERAKAGLTPLTMTRDLLDTALLRSKEIPKRFSHTRPDNTRFFTALTMQGSVRDENIAAGQTTAEAVVKAWMAAPNSKEIILNPAFTELGVGYFETVGASYSCYWVQIFRG